MMGKFPPPVANAIKQFLIIHPENKSQYKLALIIATSLASAFVYSTHQPWATGPDYWKWPYTDFGLIRTMAHVFPFMIPSTIGLYLYHKTKSGIQISLFLIQTTLLLLVFSILHLKSGGDISNHIVAVITDEAATGYFKDAINSYNYPAFLKDYPTLLPNFSFHALTKPPGPILYHQTFIRFFTAIGAADTLRIAKLYGGLSIILISSFSIPATYLLARTCGAGRAGALWASALYAIAAGPLCFSPEFDQIYPVISAFICIAWLRALKSNGIKWPIACGLLLSTACFMSYCFLTLGFFMLVVGALLSRYDKYYHTSERVVQCCAITLSTFASLYAILWIASGFNYISALIQSISLQNDILAKVIFRPYPKTIAFDYLDFFLGLSWIPLPLLAFGLSKAFSDYRSYPSMVSLACVAQIAVVGLLGILAGETARVWIFMMPLALVPVAVELDDWSPGKSAVALWAAALSLAAIAANVGFIRLPN